MISTRTTSGGKVPGGPAVKIAVLQVCDSLDAGGMERVAVNVANCLPLERFESHICATRREGPLERCIAPHVRRLCLWRKNTLDAGAVRRLIGYCRENDISILHAHASSLFIASVASLFAPFPKLIWHDHYGAHETKERPAWAYRLPATRIDGVIAVSRALAEWSVAALHIPAGKVRFIPNFVAPAERTGDVPDLPGTPGSRIVCVANLRPQKDHVNLLRAMKRVVRQFPAAHLLLLGAADEPGHLELIRREIGLQDLGANVTWLGSRDDVDAVVRGCDIGVLSSASEGLPLALIEYGMSGLPSVATRVGQCEDVLEGGRAGILVPPSSPDELADALLALLRSPEERRRFGREFQQRVQREYSADAAMGRIVALYDAVLGKEI